MIKVLAKVKLLSSADYTILRNATVAAFKQAEVMNFDDFVTNTFSSYTPVNEELNADLPGLIDKMRLLPEKKKFDGQFTLVPAAVPFRRQTVKVSDRVSVLYDEDIPDLSDKIWYSKTPSGQSVLVLDAPNAEGVFVEKPWDIK
ncbi:hypothetical protein D3C79_810530 [compost metagenome]